AEVIEDQTREGDLGRNVTFTPVRMVDGQVLWTAGDAASWVSFDVGGELDADRGADVLRHVDTVASTVDGYRLDTEVTALGGREGAERWYFRSRP
ncbi:MAG TPA: hypothetical protein VM307_12245, partial [Egibacteraceae bacterium]|nr:hypothetical protein [Egibacteraceae bacterium]